MTLHRYFADFHVHIGRSRGRPVKMAAAPSLTLENLVRHARAAKGLDIVTVIDGVCSNVIVEMQDWVAGGRMTPRSDGGLLCENGLTVIPGAEVEIRGPFGGAAHFGCWFPTVETAADFSDWLATVQKNNSLSSQVARCDAVTLQHETRLRDGLFIVHHAFTPHKGLYGNCVVHMGDMLDVSQVDALELGLSADTDMADCLSELASVSFVTNSDAHSLPKIAREYNELALIAPSFHDVALALRGGSSPRIVANYGLHPALGKYYRSRCANCDQPASPDHAVCQCGSKRVTSGVLERLQSIADTVSPVHPVHRPPYVHQVPLEFVPGLGPKSMDRLLQAFGTEMTVLHQASTESLVEVVGERLAFSIDRARTGNAEWKEGGGGTYGSMVP